MADGTELCIPIYVEIVDWKKPDPDPDPRTHLFDDIRILATVHDGIGHISDERIRKTLFEAVKGAARSIELPAGVKLGDGLFKEKKSFMAAS
jgi:hypothetical protein